MPTFAGQIDVEIEADDESEASDLLEELRKSVGRRPEVEHAAASGVECLYDCPEHMDQFDADEYDDTDEELYDDRPF